MDRKWVNKEIKKPQWNLGKQENKLNKVTGIEKKRNSRAHATQAKKFYFSHGNDGVKSEDSGS